MLRSVCSVAALALAITVAVSAEQPPSSGSAKKTHSVSREVRNRAQRVFLKGAKELEQRNPRAAMQDFGEAAALNPGERQYAISEEIAREHLVMALLQKSEKERILGHLDASRAAIQQAERVDPSNPMVREHAYELANSTAAGEPALRVNDGLAPPVELRPKSVQLSFHMRATEREVIEKVLSAYGIRATVDDSVGSRVVPFDVDNVDFAQAKQALLLATNSFLVPLDPTRALVAKDVRANRTKFERVAAETVYLPGMSAEELTDMTTLAKNVFGIQKTDASASHSTITVRGSAGDLTALNTTLKNLLHSRGEVQIDVSMYEVDRTKATDMGMILPNQTNLFNVYSEARNLLNSNSSLVQQIISSGLAAPGDWQAILAILIASGQISNSVFSQPFATFGGGLTMTGLSTSGGFLNMKLNSSNVHAVDEVEIRALDHEEATIRDGERYPIETSSYSSLSPTSLSIPGISSAGVSSALQNLGVSLSSLQSAATQAIPQVQYENIGLTLAVTPRIQANGHVSMKFDFKLSSLAGSSINGLPVLNSREFKALASVKADESAVLVSTLSRSESNAITGVPGLSELPGFSSTTDRSSNVNYSRLAIVITPHIVRAPARKAAEEMVLLPRNPGP